MSTGAQLFWLSGGAHQTVAYQSSFITILMTETQFLHSGYDVGIGMIINCEEQNILNKHPQPSYF
jgi:hypothetical protein